MNVNKHEQSIYQLSGQEYLLPNTNFGNETVYFLIQYGLGLGHVTSYSVTDLKVSINLFVAGLF